MCSAGLSTVYKTSSSSSSSSRRRQLLLLLLQFFQCCCKFDSIAVSPQMLLEVFPSCCCSLFHNDGNLQLPLKFCSKFASVTIYFICSIKYILAMVSENIVNVFTFLFLFFSDATSIKG